MRNIILITTDSLRADIKTRFIQRRKSSSTPGLDQFSKDGIVFSTAVVQGPYTTSSVPSFLTGLYPSRLKPIPSDEIAGVLMEGVPTWAELLKQGGYHTAAFHSNPLLSRLFGYDRGFDTFYDDLFLRDLRLPPKAKLILNRAQRALRIHPYMPAAGINRKALGWLREAKEPFFLWLHYMDPHGPYQPRGGLQYANKIKAERLWRKAVKRPEAVTKGEAEQLKAAYLEEVAQLDRQLGTLFEELEEMGLLERSLVIVTSDHGEAFGEHGYFTHPHHLYEELIRVPLIIRAPDIQPRQVDKPVGLVNLAPTILDFAGVKIEETFDGQSLRPLLERGDESCLPQYIISEAEFEPYIGAIRAAEWKLILNEKEGTKELYHLTEDLGEQQNVVQDYPDISRELEAKLREHLSRAKPGEGEPKPGELSEEEQQMLEDRLRDLGYL